ncbi:MAG: hypothetical protein GWN67_27170 [Phycisphaerae bacterium]|nr:hypothetical protein [Phycisphaerae bacterium]NIP51021.1 hypothetical protein [Phycisphaerae bacterium]NIS50218.1 hypothetical protein [Phycisphaerae bacterium]NIU07855.1 hypothetical protein [Phycisphaerae bacterium]NIU59913.1 hypothetical protein [Phycisphaerae bacterium]
MEAPKQIDFSPSDRIFKLWTIITLAVNITISALILLFLTVGLGKVKETRGLMDMFILFYHMVREAGGIVGAIYLLIFGSNAVLLGRVLYHKCKTKQIDGKLAVRTVMSNIAIKSWIVLILLIDIAAIVFPILTMALRRSDVSHARTHGEVYTAGGSSSSIDQWLHFCVFFWVLIFTSNALLLFRSLFHKCEKPEQATSAL